MRSEFRFPPTTPADRCRSLDFLLTNLKLNSERLFVTTESIGFRDNRGILRRRGERNAGVRAEGFADSFSPILRLARARCSSKTALKRSPHTPSRSSLSAE